MIMLHLCFLCYPYNTECTKGWYGDSCKLQCSGHCRDGVACNHVTGRCDRGCDAGWTGATCEKGKYAKYCMPSIFPSYCLQFVY